MLRGAGALYVATVVQFIGRLLYVFALARLVGPDAVGIYTLGFVAVQALGLVSVAGLDIGLIYHVTLAARTQDRDAIRATLRAGVVSTTAVSLFLTAVFAVLLPLYPTEVGAPASARLALQVFALALPAQTIVSMLGAFALALGDMRVRAIAERVVGTVAQLALVLLLLSSGQGLMGIALSYVASMWLTALVSVALVRKHIPSATKSHALWPDIKKLYVYSYAQGLSRGLGYLLMNANLFLLGWLASSVAVGVYAAASRLPLVGILFLEAFGQAFAPVAAGHSDPKVLKADFQWVTKWILILSGPLFILLALFAPTWMQFLGAEFAPGAIVLAILAVAQLVNMSTGVAAVALAVRGRPDLPLLNTILGWGTCAGLTLIWAGQHGAEGAAIAYLAAILVFLILETTEVQLVFGFLPLGRSILKPAAVLTVFALAGSVLAQLFRPSFLPVLIFSGILLTVYGFAIWRIALQVEDRTAFRDIFRSELERES